MKNLRTGSWKTAALIGMALLSLAATEARADGNGFVCSVNHSPQGINAGFGSYGYVHASLYTSPKCAGGFIGSYFFCSDGNNHQYCHSSAYHSWYSFPALMQMLQHAATNGKKTLVYTGACKLNGGANCAISVNFSATP